jgi:hypothetical protein
VALVLLVTLLALACKRPAYPLCDRDEACAVGPRHDYCVDGHCVLCRSATDCGDRERCREGKCEADPNAPAPPSPDAGIDAAPPLDDDPPQRPRSRRRYLDD